MDARDVYSVGRTAGQWASVRSFPTASLGPVCGQVSYASIKSSVKSCNPVTKTYVKIRISHSARTHRPLSLLISAISAYERHHRRNLGRKTSVTAFYGCSLFMFLFCRFSVVFCLFHMPCRLVEILFTRSGVTRVGVTRSGNWWCHAIFSWKTDDLL